ncbi:hypothetical protein LTR85_004133 [Meristemomyces frigidus]|nr:hypothetical protein LTR85_004133 [Meristemomyces frigidus]
MVAKTPTAKPSSSTTTAEQPPERTVLKGFVGVGAQLGARVLMPQSSLTPNGQGPSGEQTSTPAIGAPVDDTAQFEHDLKEAGLIGLSTYNPANAGNNCVFVTLAYLLGLKSVDDLDAKIRAHFPKPTAAGIDMQTIITVFDLTETQHHRRLKWQAWPGYAAQTLSAGGRARWRAEQFLFGPWHVSQIGILYLRNDAVGSGHCIVLKDKNPPEYVCYQTETSGADYWRDVKGDWEDDLITEKNRVIGAFAIVDD